MECSRTAYRPMPRQLPVAVEGFPFIAVALIAALAAWLMGVNALAFIMLCVAGFVTFFFRNPERSPDEAGDVVVSPADGRVLKVEEGVSSPHEGGHSTKVSIFMSVLDVHVNRLPVAARVVDAVYRAGEFFVASLDKASERNECNALVLEDARGRRYVLVQIAGLVARRIVCYLKPGDSLGIGERFGLIRFGSRLDVYLPPEARVGVSPGQRVKAGRTVIGRFA